MSVYCRVAYPSLLLKALGALSVTRDSWATVIFTDTVVVCHVEGADQSTTATATLPRQLFSEYVVTETRFAVHVPTLLDALLLLGHVALVSTSTRVVLAYPTADAKLLVELTHHGNPGSSMAGVDVLSEGRSLQSKLLTRPVKDSLLDLRFGDVSLVAQTSLLGDTLREVLNDLSIAQCSQTTLTISSRDGIRLRGSGGPYGEVDIWLKRHAECVLGIEGTVSDESDECSTRVQTAHLALACGAKLSGSIRTKGTSGGASSFGWDPLLAFGMSNSSNATGASAASIFGGFERLMLKVNRARQLSVVHMQRDHDVKVMVTVVVSPLCSLVDD